MSAKGAVAKEFNAVALARQAGIRIAKKTDVWDAVIDGRLVTNVLDNEATDKTALTAEITASAIKTIDLAYNKVSEHLLEGYIPDRITIAAGAALVTRYFVSKLRDKSRLPPHILLAKILHIIQKSPRRVWDMLGGEWKEKLGEELWQQLVDEREVDIPNSKGNVHKVLVRHYPLLDDNGQIIRHIRIHEPKADSDQLVISMVAAPGERSDYTEGTGENAVRWRVAKFDKMNKGFNNIPYDFRQLAAAAFRANIPLKEIFAMSKKALGNHANDARWNFIGFNFFDTNERETSLLGTRMDPQISEERISAKLGLLVGGNQHFADPDIAQTEGVRLHDDTLLNENRSHNEPQTDNDMTIGLDQWMRRVNPKLLAHFERCGQIDWFRNFLTQDIENGKLTTHPLRFYVATSGDKSTYHAVPLIMLGSDDETNKPECRLGPARRSGLQHPSSVSRRQACA